MNKNEFFHSKGENTKLWRMSNPTPLRFRMGFIDETPEGWCAFNPTTGGFEFPARHGYKYRSELQMTDSEIDLLVPSRRENDAARAMAVVDGIARCVDASVKPKPQWFWELRELITSLGSGYNSHE